MFRKPFIDLYTCFPRQQALLQITANVKFLIFASVFFLQEIISLFSQKQFYLAFSFQNTENSPSQKRQNNSR